MGLLKRQGWPLLGVAEMRPRPKVWMPDGGSCGGLDEFWQSDQIVAGHRAKRVRRGLGFRIEYGLEGRATAARRLRKRT